MRIFLLILFLAFHTSAYAEKVTVFAAASTTSAVNEIIAEFTRETGVKVVTSYASSGTLSKQIANSAPADIFISANSKWMGWLADKGMIDQTTIKPLLANRMALVASVKSGLQPVLLDNATAVDILTSSGRIALGDPAHTPAGMYSQRVLESLGVWGALQKSLVRMQTVRVALAMVERNAVPLGIVYSSDAAGSEHVKTVGLFDESLHGAIRYPMAVVSGKGSADVMKFYSYLKSDKSSNIFEKYGFKAVE